MTITPWRRLADAIADRRRELGMSQNAFAQATGLHRQTVRRLEQGSRDDHSDETYRAIERALGWEPGAVDHFLDRAVPAMPNQAVFDRIVRDLLTEAEYFEETRRFATPTEDAAAAKVLRDFADMLGNTMELRLRTVGAVPVRTGVEWAARHHRYDGTTRHQEAGDEDHARLMVDSINAHLATLNEPTRRMKGTERAELVRRTVVDYADGGQYRGPWTVVETKEG